MDRDALSRLLTGFSQGAAQGMNILRRIEGLQGPETPGAASFAATGKPLLSLPINLSSPAPIPPPEARRILRGLSSRPAGLSSQRLGPVLRSFQQGGRYV
jgi:hypothetical protein